MGDEHQGLRKISYRKPRLQGQRGIARLGGTDLLTSYMQVLAPGARQRLHAHGNFDGIYFVLSGRVLFREEGGQPFAEIGPNEAVIVPRGATYGFEAVGEEAEIFYVNAIDPRAEPRFLSREDGADAQDFDRYAADGAPLEENGS